MRSQTIDTHTAQKPKSQRLLPSSFKPIKTMRQLIVAGAILLGIGYTVWGMLRAEFDETFHMISVYPTVAHARTA